eukprot:SAG31_NODE_374_length_16577_cov_9.902173_12_plen_1507_part_00
MNLTVFPNQTGQHDAAIYNLNEYQSDQHTNPITDSLHSSGTESHSETYTGKSTSSSSESRSDDVDDLPVGASLSADHKQRSPVFDFVFVTSCIGLVFVPVFGSLRWYCCPKKLEERPKYLRKRCELEALDAKLKLSCVSTRLRRCVALAKIRKRFRAWRIDTKHEKFDWIGYVVGVAFLLIVMFQPVAEGSVVVPVKSSSTNVTQHYNETALVNATNVHTNMNQLAVLNVNPDLKEFIGALVTGFQSELRELKMENADLNRRTEALESANVEVKTENAEIKGENAALQSRALVVEAELRDEISLLKKDREAFQNKTCAVEAELRKENAALWITVTDLQYQAKTNSARLDQCEAHTHPFIQEMNRRRIQEDTPCRGSGLTAMFQVCCPSGSSARNGHRILQLTEGCDALPSTCSASCAPLFIEYFEGCQGITDDLAPDQRQIFVDFYRGCQEVEQAASAMLEDARPAMIFHVVVLSEAAAQQAQMFGGGSAPAPPLGPIGPLPPSPSPVGGAEIAQEFRRVCTTANLTVCVPQCNSLTYGFLLSIEIDGRGTVMTCNKVGLLFSWQGQASLGGYIGRDASAFFSSVVSGAAGTYLAMVVGDAGINADLSIERGQLVYIKGTDQAETAWGLGGFTVSDGASLSLKQLHISGHIVAAEGAALVLDSVMVEVGGCVGAHIPSQIVLIDTVSPEECLVNVKYDDSDTAAFLAALGSGLPGTYVLRVVAAAAPYTISAISVGPQQDVRLIATAPDSSLTISETVTVAAEASFSVSGALSELDFVGLVSTGAGASFIVSLIAARHATFQSPAAMGASSSLSVAGSVASLAFPAGLSVADGGAVSIRSGSPSSIAVAMGTTWYAVDPSSNQGSVTFVDVGLLSTNGETLIGTAAGTLPGALSVQLNGQQPGGGGPQSGAVLLAADGTITIPPEVSAAVGQVFTDDRIAEFVSTVNAGAPGMYGLQLRPAQAFSIGALQVSGGQDVRVFTSGNRAAATFTGPVSVASAGSLTLRGSFSALEFLSTVDLSDDASAVMSVNDEMMFPPDESLLTLYGVVTVGEHSSTSIHVAATTVTFAGGISASTASSFSLSLAAETAIFEGPVDLGADSTFSIDGTAGMLAFLAGLHTGGSTIVESSSANSIAVAMGTVWNAADPSSNQGSVTFRDIGLLDTDASTLIGTADGTLPGSMRIELNGQQLGADGAAQASVLLGADGTITIPPEISSAVGQVFAGDRIQEFLAAVSAGEQGMFGLQLNGEGQKVYVGALTVSSGQDVRIFCSGAVSNLIFSGIVRVLDGGKMTVSAPATSHASPVAPVANGCVPCHYESCYRQGCGCCGHNSGCGFCNGVQTSARGCGFQVPSNLAWACNCCEGSYCTPSNHGIYCASGLDCDTAYHTCTTATTSTKLVFTELDVAATAALTVTGSMTLLNTYVLGLLESGSSLAGLVAFGGGLRVVRADGTKPTVDGQVPGIVTLELDGNAVGTITRGESADAGVALPDQWSQELAKSGAWARGGTW